MMLTYHPGQIEAQTEANTRLVADKLARFVGPVAEFATGADVIVLATDNGAGDLEFDLISGAAPLVRVAGPATLALAAAPAALVSSASPRPCGGLAIDLTQARRARINGTLRSVDGSLELVASEAFVNCRKYIAPSVSIEAGLLAGPASRQPVSPADDYVRGLLASAETAFLASAGPDGQPDVSHRGGPPGFLRYAPESKTLTWDEYVGNGMFKSAGNVRSSGSLTLLVPDFETGDGVEILAQATFEVVRREERPRGAGLIRDRQPFPVQGRIRCEILEVRRLTAATRRRQRITNTAKFTSASALDDQAPQ